MSLVRFEELIAVDRCCTRQCGAQALIRAVIDPVTCSDVLFCGHHALKNETALPPQSVLVRRDGYPLVGSLTDYVTSVYEPQCLAYLGGGARTD
jgi:hypothetical protein